MPTPPQTFSQSSTPGEQASASRTPLRLLGSATEGGGEVDGTEEDASPSRPRLEDIPALWERLGALPLHTISRKEGLQRILRIVQDVVPAPAYYLYLLTEGSGGSTRGRSASSGRMVLEHSDLVFQRVPAWSRHFPPDASSDALQRPPMMHSAGREDRRLEVQNHWCGPLLNVPLRVGDDLVGMLLCGPFSSRATPDVESLSPASNDAFVGAVTAAVRHVKAYERLRHRVRGFQDQETVRRKMLGSTLAPDRFVGLLLNLVLTVTSSTAGFVALHDEDHGRLTVRAESGLPEGFLDAADLSLGGLFAQPPGHSDVLFVQNEKLLREFGITSMLAVPLSDTGAEEEAQGAGAEDAVLTGVFTLASTEADQPLSSFELELLIYFAEQVQTELKNTDVYEAFTERYFGTLATLSAAADGRSTRTRGHSKAVSSLAVALGYELDSTPEQIAALREAGRVHDVGLCASPVDDEQVQFNHPTIGAGLIEVLPVSEAVVEGVRTHHEWHNGWGFPQGLAGEDIPRSGCILAVAEFAAERHAGHELRDPSSLDDIARDVLQGRGERFNPYVADAFLRMAENPTGRASLKKALAEQGADAPSSTAPLDSDEPAL